MSSVKYRLLNRPRINPKLSRTRWDFVPESDHSHIPLLEMADEVDEESLSELLGIPIYCHADGEGLREIRIGW